MISTPPSPFVEIEDRRYLRIDCYRLGTTTIIFALPVTQTVYRLTSTSIN
jgi:hypothetical protein